MRRRAIAPILLASIPLASLAWGCDDSGGAMGPTVELIDPSGQNAAADVVSGTLTVEVSQDGRRVDCGGDTDLCRGPVENGGFDLTLPIRTLEGITVVHARLDGGEASRIGATPRFDPFRDGLGGLPIRLVMGRPGECAPLTPLAESGAGTVLRLPRPVRDAAVAVRRNIGLVLGGSEAAGGSSQVTRFDQLVVQSLPLEDTASPAGPARGLALSDDDSVVVADGGAWHFRLALTSEEASPIPREPITLHAGAGFASAVVDRGFDGGVVLGGAIDGAAVDGVTWIDEDGDPDGAPTRLAVPRRFPAAVALDGGVLVVGGGADGEPRAEWLVAGEDGVALGGVDGLPRASGGHLLPSPSGDAALWIGFEREDGTASPRTYLVSGCPAACAVEEAFAWDRPRLDTAHASTDEGRHWLVGGLDGDGPSRAVDVVAWRAGDLERTDGPPLQTARAGALAFEHASGVVTVAGGEGEAGLLADFEHCTPASLDPL
ncbi:MAG TPA: hypothetical protein RMH99_33030 [Sandaracinaceae bacterium LLY-WYZ-13_1]|nr:hypothetical protein [Sandaracinaceae bacterium LLY-WYZ-13_1]